MKRAAFLLIALLALGVAAPYAPVDWLRGPIERALERSLGRKVEVGAVHLTFLPGPFPGPGVELDDVTIHEDPRAGIEPFAHMDALGARIRLLGLFQRRLEFSSLNLSGDATVNLVKTDAGPWNFQFLLPSGNTRAIPALRIRGGRVNFKFGDLKSVFYFSDADLDVTPETDGSVQVRFGGAPSRTDRTVQDFGRFFVRGTASPANQHLQFKVELERSSLEETVRLMNPRGFGILGNVVFEADLSGSPAQLDVAGQLTISDIHRWDIVPQGGSLTLGYTGSLNLRDERLDLQSTTPSTRSPLVVRFRAWDFLKVPHWDIGVDLQQVPVAALLEMGRHLGAALPENVSAEGSASGSLAYNQQDGLGGSIAIRDASLKLPDAEPLQAPIASIGFRDTAVVLERTAVRLGESQSADVEGSYSLQESGSLELKISTRGLSVADMRSFGLDAIPIIDQTPMGTWRGSARYRGGDWSGDFTIQNARFRLEGFSEPLELQAGTVALDGQHASLTKMRGRVGNIPFTGDYRWEPGANRPDKFNLSLGETQVEDLRRLVAPAMLRQGGFLARTLRLGSPAPVPTWLKSRQAEGTVMIRALIAGDLRIQDVKTNMRWDGAEIALDDLSGLLDPGAIAGELTVDLADRVPHYHFEGRINDIPYKAGRLDFDGTLDAEGDGSELLESAHAEGTLKGRAIAFAPEAEFRSAAASFEVQANKWKLSNVEVSQDGESWIGSGSTQSDGRLVLDLISRGRQVRYAGALFPSAQ